MKNYFDEVKKLWYAFVGTHVSLRCSRCQISLFYSCKRSTLFVNDGCFSYQLDEKKTVVVEVGRYLVVVIVEHCGQTVLLINYIKNNLSFQDFFVWKWEKKEGEVFFCLTSLFIYLFVFMMKGWDPLG